MKLLLCSKEGGREGGKEEGGKKQKKTKKGKKDYQIIVLKVIFFGFSLSQKEGWGGTTL